MTAIPKLAASNRDSFDDVSRNPLHTAVIEPCRSWIRMSRQILNISERNALFQQIRDCRHAKRMGRQSSRKTSIRQPSLHHSSHVVSSHEILGEPSRFSNGGAKQR